jgi:hypothetical protein
VHVFKEVHLVSGWSHGSGEDQKSAAGGQPVCPCILHPQVLTLPDTLPVCLPTCLQELNALEGTTAGQQLRTLQLQCSNYDP